MSVLAVRTYVVKPENGEEFMTKGRDTFRGDKSWRLFGQVFGAYFGAVSNSGNQIAWHMRRSLNQKSDQRAS